MPAKLYPILRSDERLMQPRRTIAHPDAFVELRGDDRSDGPPVVVGGQGRGASNVAASALVLFAAATVAVTLIALWLVGWALTATAAVIVTGVAWRGKRGGR